MSSPQAGGEFLQHGTARLAAPLADTGYIVKAGDTLYRLALRFGTTVQAIMDYNGLTSTTIYVGQWLYIPATPPPPADYWPSSAP